MEDQRRGSGRRWVWEPEGEKTRGHRGHTLDHGLHILLSHIIPRCWGSQEAERPPLLPLHWTDGEVRSLAEQLSQDPTVSWEQSEGPEHGFLVLKMSLGQREQTPWPPRPEEDRHLGKAQGAGAGTVGKEGLLNQPWDLWLEGAQVVVPRHQRHSKPGWAVVWDVPCPAVGRACLLSWPCFSVGLEPTVSPTVLGDLRVCSPF